MRRLGTLLAVVSLCACATAANDAMSTLTGTYLRHFTNGTIDGAHYQSEDRLEIARIDATHASVAIGLDFFNGHSCSISGDATLEGEALVLRPPPETDGLPACQLHIAHEGDRMVFRDPENGCMMRFCGARGAFDGCGLPYASRRAPPPLSRVGRALDN